MLKITRRKALLMVSTFPMMGQGLVMAAAEKRQRRRLSLFPWTYYDSSGTFTVPVDDPSGSDGTADGLDTVTLIYDGGLSDEPTFGNQGNGKRVGGTTTDFAKILISIGVPQAGYTYTMTYDPDFSGLSQGGALAMVGFGFKQNNSYHFTGLKGDGSTGLNASKAYGPNFNKLQATTEVDGGAAAHGTQAGPNWLRITTSSDGSTYTLSTSSDGETWASEFTTAIPTPLAGATDASDFGIAIYLDAEDKGAFTVDITLWEQAIPTYAFAGAWSWFSDPRALSIDSSPVLGGVNTSGDVIVNYLSGGTEATATLKAALAVDDHINPAFLRRASDGRIIAWYSSRSGAAYYQRISTNPDDVSSWGSEVDLDSQFGLDSYDYSNPVQLTGETGDPIYLFFRAENLGERSFWYSKSTDGGATWSAATRLLDDTYRYIRVIQNGTSRIDVCASPHPLSTVSGTAQGSLFHIYYEADAWQEIGGLALTRPITLETDCTPIWDGTAGNGQAWIWDIAVDGSGQPVILYVIYPKGSDENPRYRYARWTGAAWADNEICGGGGQLMLHAGSGQEHYNAGGCFDHADPDVVYVVQRFIEKFELLRGVTADNGATWSFSKLAEQTNVQEQLFRPTTVRGQVAETRLAYLDGPYAGGTSIATTQRLMSSAATATAAPSASAPFAVVRRRLRPGTGVQQFTVPGFGTPKAARFTVTLALNDGTARDGIAVSVGATDGTNQYAVAGSAQHGGLNSVTFARAATDEVIMVLSTANGAPAVEANFDAWVTDGVGVNITVNGGSADYYVTVELFGGADLTAVVGTTALATQNNSVTLTPGFQTNMLFLDSTQRTFNDTAEAAAILSMGLASYDGTTTRQCSQIWRSDSSQATGAVQGEVSSTRLAAFLSSRYVELHSITSTQFQLRSLGGDLSSAAVGYLALNFGAAHEAWAGVVDSPTTTGDHDFTGPDFTPVYGHIIPTMIATADAAQTDGTAGVQGVSVFTAQGEYCTSWADEDASDPTDNQIVSTAKAIDIYDHAGVAAFAATFSSFPTKSARLNFTDADATARKWPAVFIG